MTEKVDLRSMLPEELVAYVKSIGEPAFRAKQLFSWFSRGVPLAQMSNLPKGLREKLGELMLETLPRVEKKLVSAIDGTVKYLFSLYDGACIESVFMRYKHGNTLCISSQVGCRMGCRFCASTIGGRERDLLPSELLGQIIAAEADSGERVSNVVMMGIGEPLDNYDNVIKFLKLVNLPEGLGISYRNISLSTCGIVPKILKLAEESFPITLSISLHAPNDTARSEIMPINNSYGVSELLYACNEYFQKTGRRISFEYTLISGKNDSDASARELSSVLKKHIKGPLHVNLIPLNPVSERDYKTVDRGFAKKFCEKLNSLGINATVRRTLGPDINASCGQLRRSEESNN